MYRLAVTAMIRATGRSQVIRNCSSTGYKYIITEHVGVDKDVGLITLNRPKEFNALCNTLIQELSAAIDVFESDKDIGAMVVTGSKRAFSAGADIPEMRERNFSQMYTDNSLAKWKAVANARKPIIAAVSGYALGGGCELAMMCDIIYAADNAKFGQPEITIGVIPGAGGTQRLIRSVGKSLASEMILTGCRISAQEAKEAGLVSKVLPADDLLKEAIKTAEEIAKRSRIATMMAKQAIQKAYETTLEEGLNFERQLFYSTFSTQDQKEGMGAFLEKRKPKFTGC